VALALGRVIRQKSKRTPSIPYCSAFSLINSLSIRIDQSCRLSGANISRLPSSPDRHRLRHHERIVMGWDSGSTLFLSCPGYEAASAVSASISRVAGWRRLRLGLGTLNTPRMLTVIGSRGVILWKRSASIHSMAGPTQGGWPCPPVPLQR